VVLKETGRPIGRTGLVRQVVDGQDEDEIGYMFHHRYWRQGYASEAAKGVRDYAFYRLNRSRVISLIRPMNIPSQRTALTVGMKPEKLTMHYDMEHLVYALARQEGGDAEAGRQAIT
jgi:RimJ/RimL family protein N-acetyltransferase